MTLESLLLRVLRRLHLLKPSTIEPPPYEKKREVLLRFLNKFQLNTAIETGTFLGDTTAFLAKSCDTVYSIELAEQLAKNALERFANVSNVTIIHGDSSKCIPELLTNLPGKKLFWLDGHFSGTCFQGESKIVTARGDSDTPVVAELQAILNDSIAHVILIDDARLFDGLSDYPSLRRVKALCKSSPHRYSVSVADDIIQISPEPEL